MKKLLLLALAVYAVEVSAQRVPVFEVFSSSTCGPCKPGNAVYKGVVSAFPSSEYVSLKYQQNFPGNGDPYCTAETQSRRSSYYAINSIPRMEIDGGWDQNAQSFTTALYNSTKAIPAEYKMTGAFTLLNKVVTAKIKYSPTTAAAAAAGATLHVVIVESSTKNNVKSNGETEFYDVVKKMLPNQNGTTLGAKTINAWDSTTLTFTFAGSYRLPVDGKTNLINHATEHSVEDFANLKVVAWIQGANKSIFQGLNLMKVTNLSASSIVNTINNVTVFPNPATNNVNIDLNVTTPDNITALIVDLSGKVVAQKSADMKAGKNQMSIDIQNVASGYYNVIIVDSKSNSHTAKLLVTH